MTDDILPALLMGMKVISCNDNIPVLCIFTIWSRTQTVNWWLLHSGHLQIWCPYWAQRFSILCFLHPPSSVSSILHPLFPSSSILCIAAHLVSPLALLEVPVCVVISHPRLAVLLCRVCKVPWYKEPNDLWKQHISSHLRYAASNVCGILHTGRVH